VGGVVGGRVGVCVWGWGGVGWVGGGGVVPTAEEQHMEASNTFLELSYTEISGQLFMQ
jgi:hypothetical protein